MSLTLRRAKHITIVIALVGSLLSLITIPAQAVDLTCAQGGACIVGDTGPGGGKVFYVASGTFTQTGATGAMCSTYCKYLEAAPTSGSSAWTDADYAWSGNTNTLIGASAQGTAIGSGYANTLAIVGQSSGGSTADKAGTASRAYRGPNGKTDWFLPSQDELHQLRLEKTTVAANVVHANYWSSTEISATIARYLYFLDNTNFVSEHSKSLASGIAVRPIRAFGSAPYDGTNGVVSCGTSGAFTILNNAVSANASSANASCVGSVTIPEGVTAVSNNVFYGVSGVTSVSLPSTLLTIGSSAFRTTSISTIRIPASVTSISDLAFSINAVAVTSLTFDSPSSLTTIGNYVFQYSDFSTVTIPASVTSMGTDVFNVNTDLTSIYFLGSKPGGSTSSIYGAALINVYVTTAAAAGFGATWLGAAVSSPPAAPTSLSATAGDGQVSIAFTAGSNNGSAITNYKYSTDGTSYTAFSPSDTTTPVVIPGLTNGTSYTITLKAVNTAGESVASSSVTATPVAPVTVISVAAIGGVTAPVRAATPVTTVTAANGYTGTVTWSGSPTTFAASTSYTATITLTAASGYTLTGVTANFFTVTGATSVTHSANSGVITAVFPTTAAIVSDNSTTEKVETGPPPSFLKVKTPPTISLIADIYTCTAGTLIFWRYSVTEEPSKITYQKISLLKNGEIVASSLTLKSQASFEKNSSWAGSTMTCQIEAAQENTVSTFSSLAADKYNELSKIKAAEAKAAEAKYFTDRKAAYDTRRVDLSRISNEKASELKVAKTSAQVKAAAEKYRLAMTRITQTWKAEIQAAPARRDASKAAATATFIQGLAQHGLSIIQP